ncbi:DUF6376 family protein [Virgibacillus oceani]|uniref:Lipoprotein n=1 Tax=Virgibacillus oceani TaxID=1479511 RepID=A0A917HLC7_9BACI|nr:DUF6376 family protein [Virgibacillus oceani]GGG83393.1 hypothetical protein GCM10011398_31280 [Virgibacillus oceani]
MKKQLALNMVIVFFVLSGCSMLEDANNSLNYVNESTEYINNLRTFAEDAASLEGADLEARLEKLKGNIQDFLELEAPDFAANVHKELEAKSQVLLDATNNVLQSGEIAIDQLQQSEIFQTIGNITDLLNQIEQLGL